uniref:DUF4219 domain-containing protein n=1 Tax=Cucumis melo TaxID=3656 RepID=A0A9I9E769_CUCME
MEKSEISRPISTILDGSNYITWTNQMKSFLIGRKLWRVVTGDITKPTKQDKEDDSKFIKRLEEWDDKNHQIITWLSKRGQSVNEYLAVLQPIWTQLDQATISKDHLRLIKVLRGLRPEYESIRAALLHRSPLPSLGVAIQEILFEEKTYCHKPDHILDNCPIKPPRPRSYSTRAKNFTKSSNSSVAAVAPDNSTTPQFQISDLQSLLNQLISSSSSALAVSPEPCIYTLFFLDVKTQDNIHQNKVTITISTHYHYK